MAVDYNSLLKEHIIHALTNPQAETLKEFAFKLIGQNGAAREEITQAYKQINEELVGAVDL